VVSAIEILFRETSVPDDLRDSSFARDGVWLTWSSAFLKFASRLRRRQPAVRPPRVVRVGCDSHYDRTFTSDPSIFEDDELAAELHRYAYTLTELEPGDELILLDGLIGNGLDGLELRDLLAALRDAVVRERGDQQAALYAPLGSTGPTSGQFRLHADLYVPHKMMNIFDQVPTDGSGTSLFLGVDDFFGMLSDVGVPLEIVEQLESLFKRRLERDSFQRMQQLLYPSRRASWSDRLEQAMARRCRRLRLRAGQGYLINDRRWLHGREAPSGGVHPRRLHRLVFS